MTLLKQFSGHAPGRHPGAEPRLGAHGQRAELRPLLFNRGRGLRRAQGSGRGLPLRISLERHAATDARKFLRIPPKRFDLVSLPVLCLQTSVCYVLLLNAFVR